MPTFETTTKKNLDTDGFVRVWLWSLVHVETKTSYYGFDIESFIRKVKTLKVTICYFHNLKFDGSFLADYSLKNNIPITKNMIDFKSKTWYSITINGTQYRDSMKKFPMSVNGISVVLGVKGKDVKPDFDRYLPIGYIPTLDEIKYCIQDSQIVAQAIEKELDAGRILLTSSSEAFAVAKNIKNFDSYFPQLDPYEDDYVRHSYKGGVCYLVPQYQNKILENIYTYDVNSLYPSVMVQRPLPYGIGWNEEPRADQLYVVHFFGEFELNEGYLPTLQLKKNAQYINQQTEYLTHSNGSTEMYLTNIDYDLAHEHYTFSNEFGHEYKTYNSKIGVLADVINKNNAIKEQADKDGDGFLRNQAKLNNNMTYGAFGINPHRYGCELSISDKNKLDFDITEQDGKGRYVPYASFVTSWARYITLTSAQKNYETYVYSDTDSIHLLSPAENIKIHSSHLGQWKHEEVDKWGIECYPRGKYIRQKAYVHADEHYNIYNRYDKYGNYVTELKYSGIPDEAKKSIKWDDFYAGYPVIGKLENHVVPGGVCLMPTDYTL